jgi:hypothetical protein
MPGPRKQAVIHSSNLRDQLATSRFLMFATIQKFGLMEQGIFPLDGSNLGHQEKVVRLPAGPVYLLLLLVKTEK